MFLRDLGNSMALTHCKKTTVPLSPNNTYCYHDIKLQNGYFLDIQNHVLKFNSSTRPCQPNFPYAIIKTLSGAFVSAEPNLMSVHVDSNVSILGNLSHAPIDFMQDDQGLATAEEWRSLAESIQYSGLRSMLSENLMTSLCLDSVHCNSLVSGVKPTVNYNPKVLNMPTAEQIKTRL